MGHCPFLKKLWTYIDITQYHLDKLSFQFHHLIFLTLRQYVIPEKVNKGEHHNVSQTMYNIIGLAGMMLSYNACLIAEYTVAIKIIHLCYLGLAVLKIHIAVQKCGAKPHTV